MNKTTLAWRQCCLISYTGLNNKSKNMSLDLEQIIIEPVLPAEASDIQELTINLRAYNHQQAGQNIKQPIGCFIRDLQGNLIGGVYAELTWGWCCIELLWVNEKYRHNNLASQLINKIEQYAFTEGINHIKLETASFQALDFYKKMGFELYATLEDFPVGHSNYYLKKICGS